MYFEGQDIAKATTPKTLSSLFDNKPEGGIFKLKNLFDDEMNTVNLSQAGYILHLDNWTKFESYGKFKEDFVNKTKNISDTHIPLIRLKEGNYDYNKKSFCYIARLRMEES
jgi:hypothetical protein